MVVICLAHIHTSYCGLYITYKIYSHHWYA